MRAFSTHKVGQSSQELLAASLFSFVIHGLLLATALFFSMIKTFIAPVPVSYQVALVQAPADAPQTLSPALPPAPSKPAAIPEHKPAPAPKARTAVPKTKAASLPKNVIPELDASKEALKKKEPQQTEAPVASVKSPPASTASSASVGPAAKTESVAVSSPHEAKLGDYLPRVRDKIERNWNPPPVARGAKVKVLFQILHSGRAGEVKLQDSSGNFYFDQAAIRAIRSSSPFPALPEDFPRELVDLSVDLAEKE